MKNEIGAGLKNALERHQSLERAMQSFINAGYNEQEVRAAGNDISAGASDIVYSEKREKKGMPAVPERKIKKKKGKKVVMVLGIIFSLVIFLGAVGYLLYVVFWS